MVSGGKVVRQHHAQIIQELVVGHRYECDADRVGQDSAVGYPGIKDIAVNALSLLVVSFCKLHPHN